MNKQSILILAILIILFGCSDDSLEPGNEIITSSLEFITSVNAPTTGKVGEKIDIEVKFHVLNGCGDFARFVETEYENTKTIEVEAKYEGLTCTQATEIITVNYEFTPKNARTYKLKLVLS
jgi:hypothetical protein